MEYLTFRHVVNLGDLVSVLPGIRQLYRTTGKKAIIYQQLNRPGEYFEGAIHPTKNIEGQQVCFNEQMFEMMRPLLIAQDYIEDFRVWKGETVDYDLDVVRLQVYCGAPNYPLHKWTWMAYPEMACDLSPAWIRVNPYPLKYKKIKIVINFTQRYRNYNINYFFLKQYQEYIAFVGTEKEYEIFKNTWGLDISYWPVKDFLDLVIVLSKSKLFLGNQSFCWHLAEAIKMPRILELDPCFQNCTSFGPNGYEAYHQHAIEYYVHKLLTNGNNGEGLPQAYWQNNNDSTSNTPNANIAGEGSY